jgi:hypothetical protein
LTAKAATSRTGCWNYFPDWLLERRRRAERALTTVVATYYLLGVSTRRMEMLGRGAGYHPAVEVAGQRRVLGDCRNDSALRASRVNFPEPLRGQCSGSVDSPPVSHPASTRPCRNPLSITTVPRMVTCCWPDSSFPRWGVAAYGANGAFRQIRGVTG